MDYDEEATLINLFGDEWGGGELWDLYQSIENPDKFFSFFIYFIVGLFVISGILCIVLYSIQSGTKSKTLLYTGLGCIFVGIIILVLHHFF